MFGGVNVWRIAKAKEIGEIKFGELIDFIHKDAIFMLNFGWLKFGEPWTARQIRQTFPLYSNRDNQLNYQWLINHYRTALQQMISILL